MISRPFNLLPILVLLTISLACKREESKPALVDPHYRVAPSPVGSTLNILDKTFNLKKSATFPFEIPAHAVRPHLQGKFESFVHGEAASEDAANVDFMILNESQHADLEANHPTESVFSAGATHSQEINIDLPAAFAEPAKYYLVFQSADGGKTAKVVKANFHVDF